MPGDSEAVTRGIRVHVQSRYSAEHSEPEAGQWVFVYHVKITNESDQSVQLLSRHWIITDGNGRRKEVQGAGVVGDQPVIEPGESYLYNSFCPLPTPVGSMEGSYHMVVEGGEHFEARIARFSLTEPTAVN